MDPTLRWFAQFTHNEHRNKSDETNWYMCDLWPCYHLRMAVLAGIPAPYEEVDGAGKF